MAARHTDVNHNRLGRDLQRQGLKPLHEVIGRNLKVSGVQYIIYLHSQHLAEQERVRQVIERCTDFAVVEMHNIHYYRLGQVQNELWVFVQPTSE